MTANGESAADSGSDGGTVAYEEVARLYQVLDLVATKVVYCDKDLIIRYVNRSAKDTLRKLEQHLPKRVHELVGCSIDIFHKQATPHRARLFSLRDRKHRAVIALGPEQLSITVATVTGAWGVPQGYVVTWEVVTERMRCETEQRELREHIERVPVDVGRMIGKVHRIAESYDALRTLLASAADVVGRLEDSMEWSKGTGSGHEVSKTSRTQVRDAAQRIAMVKQSAEDLELELRQNLRSLESALQLVSVLREHARVASNRTEAYTREHRPVLAEHGEGHALTAMAAVALRTVEDTKRAAQGKVHPEERRALLSEQDELLARVRAGKPLG